MITAFIFISLFILARLAFKERPKKSIKHHLPAMQQEWIALANKLQLTTNFSEHPLEAFHKGLAPTIQGKIMNVFVHISLDTTDMFSLNSTKCHIEIENPEQLRFALFKNKERSNKNNVFGDPHFDASFNLISTNIEVAKLIFDSYIRKQILETYNNKPFNIRLYLQEQATLSQETLLDTDLKSILSLSENELFLINEEERISFEKKIITLVEIALRIKEYSNQSL